MTFETTHDHEIYLEDLSGQPTKCPVCLKAALKVDVVTLADAYGRDHGEYTRFEPVDVESRRCSDSDVPWCHRPCDDSYYFHVLE